MIRNLFFHIYPLRGTFWGWHVDVIRSKFHLFNGRKLVHIVYDHETVDPHEVARNFTGVAEVVVRRNDARLGETAHYLRGIESLQSSRRDEMTFYCHSKGVARGRSFWPNTKAWAAAMYEINLCDPGAVEKLMETHDAVGCFRLRMPHAGSDWHYSGTFFWFNHAGVFSNPDWSMIEQSRHGVEGWIGRLVPFDRSATLFDSDKNLYHQTINPSEYARAPL